MAVPGANFGGKNSKELKQSNDEYNAGYYRETSSNIDSSVV